MGIARNNCGCKAPQSPQVSSLLTEYIKPEYIKQHLFHDVLAMLDPIPGTVCLIPIFVCQRV